MSESQTCFVILNVRYDQEVCGVFDTLQQAKEAIEKCDGELEWMDEELSDAVAAANLLFVDKKGFHDWKQFLIIETPKNQLVLKDIN